MVIYNVYDPIVEDKALAALFLDPDTTNTSGFVPPPISRDEIERMTYRQGIRFVRDKLKISTDALRTEKDIKDFLRLKFYPSNEESENEFRDIEEQIKECYEKQMEISNICQLVQAKLIEPNLPGVNDIVAALEPALRTNWREKVEKLKKAMEPAETAILIAGETGAGKSSLINMLLNKDILPEAEHPCTGTICVIKGSDQEYVRLWEGNSEHRHLEMIPETTAETESFITMRDAEKHTLDRHAEFHCNLPILKNSSYFVDTPGFRDMPFLTDLLYRFLPKASAFIVVLRSDNHTGINPAVEDFITQVRKKLEEFKIETTKTESVHVNSNAISEESVIFVFNHWDKIVDENHDNHHEIERRRQKCLTGLRGVWGKVEEGVNVFFMSVTKTKSMIKYSKKMPPDFLKFQKEIYNMIPRCLNIRLKVAYSWLYHLCQSFLNITRKKISHARKDKTEKEKEVRQLQALLAQTKKTFSERLEVLLDEINKHRRDLQTTLLAHVKSEEVVQRICDFENDEENYKSVAVKPMEPLPEAEDIDNMMANINTFCFGRMAREIQFWNECKATHFDQQLGRHIVDETKTEFAKFMDNIRMIFKVVFREIEERADAFNQLFDCESFYPSDNNETPCKSHFLSNLEKVFFGITAVIWVPLVIVGGAVSLPVIAGLYANDVINNRNQIEKFRKNKEKVIDSYLRYFIKNFKEPELDYIIHESVLKNINILQSRLANYLPSIVETFEQQIKCLTEDQSTSKVIEKTFKPIREEIEIIFSHIFRFQAYHLRVYEVSPLHLEGLEDITVDTNVDDIMRRESVKRRSYGAFGEVIITRNKRSRREVAVKFVREPVSRDNAFKIFSEEGIWRRLCLTRKNWHFLELYGLLGYGEDVKKVAFVMEACSCTLKQLLQTRPNLVPYLQDSLDEKEIAFRDMIHLAKQIIDGLRVMHELKIVHRNLRTDNILVSKKATGYDLKLCDFSESRSHSQITTTVLDAPYISPEVSQTGMRGWTEAADIYAFGFIMWEMYHGMRPELNHLQQGPPQSPSERPKCPLDFPDRLTPILFIEVVAQCTVSDAVQRSSVMGLEGHISALQTTTSIFPKRSIESHPTRTKIAARKREK